MTTALITPLSTALSTALSTDTATQARGFDQAGSGEPALLFVPGWCGNRTVFDELAAITAQTRSTLTMDLPEHGDWPRTGADVGYADVVDLAECVLERTGVDRVVPVTLSHAGWAVIELRRRLGPDRVPGLIFIDWMPLGAPAPFRQALAGLQDPASWSVVRQRLFDLWTSGIELPALHETVAAMGCYGAAAWQRAGREIARAFDAEGSPVAALDRLDRPCPTLHLYAQPDDGGFLAAQQAYAAEHPWFEVERLEARSHFPMLEVPEGMSAVIEDFAGRVG